MALAIELNGEIRTLAETPAGASLAAVIAALELKGDRVAVERNGSIVRRADWDATAIADGDKLEIVHFVGGGLGARGASAGLLG